MIPISPLHRYLNSIIQVVAWVQDFIKHQNLNHYHDRGVIIKVNSLMLVISILTPSWYLLKAWSSWWSSVSPLAWSSWWWAITTPSWSRLTDSALPSTGGRSPNGGSQPQECPRLSLISSSSSSPKLFASFKWSKLSDYLHFISSMFGLSVLLYLKWHFCLAHSFSIELFYSCKGECVWNTRAFSSFLWHQKIMM